MNGRLASWLASLVAVGFFAWAGVVWTAVSRLDILASNITIMAERQKRHEVRGWHEEAGVLIQLQAGKLNRIEIDINRLEQKVDQLLNTKKRVDLEM
jgi:hypothetical protein